MAGDTAALVVALSAQLTKFEKDMKGAVDIANARTKEIENSFARMNQSINSELSGFIQGYASRLGALGTVLTAIGPVGLTIAAAIGAATIAVGFLNEKVDKFVEKQKAMREAAEVTGLTLDQLKAIGQSATRTGVDFEKAERGIIKMATAIDDLRQKGTGPLVDSLNKLNPELVRQLINANSTAEAFDILSNALDQMEGDFKKVGFAADVFGKRNIELLRVLQDLVRQGGLVKNALDLQEQGKGVDKELNERLVNLQRTIDATRKRADNMFGQAFSIQQKQAQLEAAQIMERIAAAALSASNYMVTFVDRVNDYVSKKLEIDETSRSLSPGGIEGFPPERTAGVGPQGRPAEPVIPLPTARPTGEINTALAREAITKYNEELDKQKALLQQDILFAERWVGVLGDAITPAEQYQQQQVKINKALQDYAPESQEAVKLQEAGNRSLQRLNEQQVIAANNLRERFMLLTEEQIVQNKLAQARLEAEKAGLRDIDLTKLAIVYRKQAKDAIEQQVVSLSKLPEVTRYAQQALDGFKNADQFLVSFAGNFESAMGDIATSSKTAAEAFKHLADSIIRDLVRMTIRMSVTGPLFKALGTAFGAPAIGTPGFGDFGNPFGRQSGGPVRAGSPYIVGEHGPELFVPKSAGNIVPNQPMSKSTGAGLKVTVNNYTSGQTDTSQEQRSGPTGEELIINIVKKVTASGELDSANRARFGLRAVKVR